MDEIDGMSSGDTGGVAKVFFPFLVLFSCCMVWHVEWWVNSEGVCGKRCGWCFQGDRAVSKCETTCYRHLQRGAHIQTRARTHTHTHIADRAVSNSETACYRHLQRGALSHTHAHTHLHFTTGYTALSNSETAYYRHLQRGKLPEDPLSRVQMLKNTVLSPSPVAAPPAAEVCVCVRSCVCVCVCVSVCLCVCVVCVCVYPSPVAAPPATEAHMYVCSSKHKKCI